MKSKRPIQPPVRRKNHPPTTSFLLEIGSEELPWQMIQPAMTQLAQLMEHGLGEQRLSHGRIRSFGTPRRLSVIVEDLARKQTPVSQEVLGPSKAVAFDAQGRPTKASEGFAQSQGVDVNTLVTRKTPKGVYVCAVKRQPGLSAARVLTEHLPGIIQQLTFPKTMRWNASGVRYPRPIRWVVALLGTKVLSIEVAGVRSGARSWGHRFMSGGKTNKATTQGLDIRRPEDYETVLERAGVVADPLRRRALLGQQLKHLARSAKGAVYQANQEDLLDQAVFSLECPNILLGTFDKHYLALPPEVLITSMKEHQGFFSVVNRKQALLPRFLAPTNMKIKNMELIRTGNERVLAARLADAQYFYNEDRKGKLAERVTQLNGVVFHKQLGSLYQKTERTIVLVGALAQAAGTLEVKEACQRAALLCKADLVTGMVGEFPALQGVMGKKYAAHDGESAEVCEAIGEYYQPRTPDDDIPRTTVGRLLSIADRVDTLAAFFHAGIVPSGSEDPFGLRRTAFGLIRIVIEAGLTLPLGEILRQAEQLLAQQGVKAAQQPTGEQVGQETPPSPVLGFLLDRLRFYGRTLHGYREDVMESVIRGHHSADGDIRDVFLRMDALQAITNQRAFDPLMIGFKRAHRIVEKEAWASSVVKTDLLTHSTEHTLHQAVETARQVVAQALSSGDYHGALKRLIELKGPIDEFFDGVLVNAPEPDRRANRLSLLRRVDELFSSFGDLSHIQVQGQ